MSRQYLIGLPVVVTVHEDGTVDYAVCAEDASVALLDADHEYGEEQVAGDVKRVDADLERRGTTEIVAP